jgi:hypothetical protein
MKTTPLLDPLLTAHSADLAASASSLVFEPAHASAAVSTDQMYPGVFGLAAAAYGAMMLSFWLLFVSDVGTFLSLAVCTAYFGMYFGVPAVMHRVARQAETQVAGGSLGQFLRSDLETITGPISGWAAVTQVLVIPVSLTVGIIAMGLIVKSIA